LLPRHVPGAGRGSSGAAHSACDALAHQLLA
jgi:hypothetical protein